MERTDFLTGALGISLRALAPRLGLSVASLFGYRSGKIPISKKGWSKLEHLEKVVQKDRTPANFATSLGNPKYPVAQNPEESLSTLRDDVAVYRTARTPEGDVRARISMMEIALSGLEAQVALMKDELNRLKAEL